MRSAIEGTEYVSLGAIDDDVGDGRARAEDGSIGRRPTPPPRDIDPRVLVSAISAMVLGWASVEDWVWPTAGLDPADKDEVYRQLMEIVGYMADRPW